MIKNVALTLLALLVLKGSLIAQNRETRNVDDFDEINLGIPADLFVKQGSKSELIIQGDADDLEDIETRVSGGSLTIKNKSSWWSWSGSSPKIKIYATVKNLRGLSVSGSGSIETDGKIKAESRLDLSVSGSGEIFAELDAEDIRSAISGSGDIQLKGKGDSNDVSISGSGSLDALDMDIEIYEVTISGSGSCRISVSKELEGRISGSGKILYRGEPERFNLKSSGSGTAKKIN